jgi:hypothetical protein
LTLFLLVCNLGFQRVSFNENQPNPALMIMTA